MDRLQKIFGRRNSPILSIYFTAGYPSLKSTIEVIEALDAAGVDLVEIGIPFSDPIADGPTIQESNNVALKNGMSVSLLFTQLQNIRAHTQMPLLLMGYLNPILQYGFENFCKEARKCGIDALIIPDIPLDEYENTYRRVLDAHELKLVLLITPQTTQERVLKIDRLSTSFIYLVTASSVTGKTNGFNALQIDYLKRIKDMELSNPILAGFGIGNAEDFRTVTNYVQGAIIGSRFIDLLKNTGEELKEAIFKFVRSIRA